MSCTLQSIHHTYTLEDSTGTIDAIMWIDQDESEYMVRQRQTWKEKAYVRVVGNLRVKQQSNQKNINAFHLRVVTDFNEITYHLLDSIHSHLYNTQGPKASAPPTGSSNFASPGKPSTGPSGGAAPGGASTGAGAAISYSAPASGAGGIQSLHDVVVKAFEELSDNGSGAGISVTDLANYASQRMGREIMKSAISVITDQLSMEGHIYSTVDEEHFTKI